MNEKQNYDLKSASRYFSLKIEENLANTINNENSKTVMKNYLKTSENSTNFNLKSYE